MEGIQSSHSDPRFNFLDVVRRSVQQEKLVRTKRMKSWEDWFGSMAVASERSKSQSEPRNKWSNAWKVETHGSREERQTDEAKTGKRRQTKSHAIWPGRSMKVKDGKNSRRKKGDVKWTDEFRFSR